MLASVMFLNGLAIMVLEMVGARLLAPWLGTSITVWTSLIGIILACMSVGYWLGGRFADRILAADGRQTKGQPPVSQYDKACSALVRLLLGAASTVLLTALIHSIVLMTITVHIKSLHTAAVAAALLLFSLPSLMCGMVSPFTMRLAITRNEEAGSVIGRLNAISTIGSILGTFLGGFVLISFFGSKEIIFGVAACLIVAALLVKARPFRPFVGIVLMFAFALAYHTYFVSMATASDRITVESPYNTMQILDRVYANKPARYLMTDPGSAQSATYLDNPTELLFSYTQFYRLAPAFVPQAQNVLMLGGGGYSVPKWLLDKKNPPLPTVALDVVELDPGMTKVAQDYFFAPKNDPRVRIFHEDARMFLNRTAAQADAARKYQMIFTDVFNSYYTVPFHVGTREAAEKMRTLLDDNGVLMMNIITAIDGDDGRLLRGIYHAFASVFPEVHIIPVQFAHEGATLQNVMLMAFATPRHLDQADITHLPPDLRGMLENRWKAPIATDVPALTDNFAPVEKYTLNFAQK